MNVTPTPMDEVITAAENNLVHHSYSREEEENDDTSREHLVHGDHMITSTSSSPMSFLVSQSKEQNKSGNGDEQTSVYSCSIHGNNVTTTHTDDHKQSADTETEKEYSESNKISTSSNVISQAPAYFTSYGNSDIQSQLSTRSGYEVTTFVTEDGQTGQIIISGNGSYTQDINSSNGVVTLGDTNIATITSSDGNVLSLGEDAMEQLAGLENFPPGAIQVATTQNADGTTHLQYILKEDANIQEESSHNNSPRKIYPCSFEKCDKQFSSPYRLKLHSRTHSGDTVMCMIEGCGKSFLTQTDMQKHAKTHIGSKDFVCEVDGCKKEYTTAHHLKVHKRQHSGERPFLCEWDGCGKMFTTGYGLKSHFRTHTNERPYKCQYDECLKAFKTSGDLQKHVRTHTGERPFVCTYSGCDRSFTTSNIRKVHLRTHTGEKPYRCEVDGCGRTFASATNYKNHSRIHTGERPYVCEVPGCMKRFTEYSSLYKHNIVHTQQKPYTCTLCHKTYRQTSTLAMHKRTVHGTEDLTDTERHVACDSLIRIKKPKIAPNNRLTPTSSATGYIQGMSLIINNSGDTSQDFSARISAQNLSESTEIPGAIAIPIQVTMNPDGTIAGAPGLNLTDGNGRIIPVNLSVSIPMSSLTQVNENSQDGSSNQSINSMYQDPNKLENVIEMLPEDSGEITPRQSNSATVSDDGDRHIQRITKGKDGRVLVSPAMNVRLINDDTSSRGSDELITGVIPSTDRHLMRSNISDDFDDSDDDADDRDVTDKYLTSHYRKDAKAAIT